MGIRKHKPTTPGRRGSSVADFVEVTKKTPEKALLAPSPKKGGRNVHGRITARHQGGGHKQRYRVVDFRRTKDGVPAKVAAIEYDPNRTARLALLHYRDGEKRYIIAPTRLKVGDIVESGEGADIKPGNALPLKNIPVGTIVHNVELRPGGGAKMGRSAGSGIQLLAKEGPLATLRMPSGEIRQVLTTCRATVGEVGNAEQELISWGKAGRNRWKGKRPTTRGVAMNPVDHPLGGGEARAPAAATRPARGASPRVAPAGASPPTSSSSAAAARGEGARYGTQSEEGAVRRRPPVEEDRRAEPQARQAGDPHLVAALDDHPRHGRAHDRGPRRAQARARVHLGVHGRPQARRIRADPDLPHPPLAGAGDRSEVTPIWRSKRRVGSSG